MIGSASRLAMWLLAAVAMLHAGEATVSTAAGVVLATRGSAAGGPVTVNASGVVAGGTTLAWASVATFAQPRIPASGMNGGVVTVDGEILRGLPVELATNALRWNSDLLGVRSQPLEGLAAIVLGPVTFEGLPGLLTGEPGVVLVNGERVAGKLSFLNAEAVGLDTGRRVAQVPRGRAAIVLLRPVQPLGKRARTWLQLVTGDRVLVGGALEPSPLAVIAGWIESLNSVQLADLPPRRAAAVDRQGAALPLRPGAGFPAVVGGLATPKGVRVPARGEIAWDCAGFDQLLAWAACPDGAETTHAAVILDGAVAWEQSLKAGAAAVAVVVPLRGAREVVLRSTAEADGETSRRCIDWGMPTLAK